MLVTTRGSGTGWGGRKITHENGRSRLAPNDKPFQLIGHGQQGTVITMP